MAQRVSGRDALRAWPFIRASRAYRQAWDRRYQTPGLPEPAPFPVRLRTAADTRALRSDMLAWEDTRSSEPRAPFWVSAGIIDGRVTRAAAPLVWLATEGWRRPVEAAAPRARDLAGALREILAQREAEGGF
ncbi:MAG: hypothetical protein OYL41_10750 [Acidobacteriota bacterium]|nr:hypothetical protein [Acidobacteriota bacterium]